ncbi:MAG: hypothetical protein WCE61_12340, partial [Candidatus Acidiferrum sp.]
VHIGPGENHGSRSTDKPEKLWKKNDPLEQWGKRLFRVQIKNEQEKRKGQIVPQIAVIEKRNELVASGAD